MRQAGHGLVMAFDGDGMSCYESRLISSGEDQVSSARQGAVLSL
jgi:hypothetical protein